MKKDAKEKLTVRQNFAVSVLESQILFDADKLDSFGSIGVVRNILVYYNKKPIDYILEELNSKWSALSLDESRKYAKKEYNYTRDFFVHLRQELLN